MERTSIFSESPGIPALREQIPRTTNRIFTPAQDAWNEYEDCLLYHAYTEEELAAQKADAEPTKDMEKRVAALEKNQSELQEALDMILTGVTE